MCFNVGTSSDIFVFQLEKEYVCRVEGEFPEGELICEEPILVIACKIGLCRVDPTGKECRTVFQRLSFNGKTSVVRCLPLTGRTHQIRVHLQYLGFPILNDPIYGALAWGSHRGKGGIIEKNNEELLQALVEEHRSQENLHVLDLIDDCTGVSQDSEKSCEKVDKLSSFSEPAESGGSEVAAKQCVGDNQVKSTESVNLNENKISCNESPTSTKSNDDSTTADRSAQKNQSVTRDHLCSECKLVRSDPTNKELLMYLHALRYKGPDFEYSTRLPAWAKEDWVETE